MWPTTKHEELFTQNVTNITFIFEASPNTKPKGRKWVDMPYYVPPSETVGGHVPRVPNQMAPMRESIVLLPEDIILCVSTEPAMPATFDSRECVEIE